MAAGALSSTTTPSQTIAGSACHWQKPQLFFRRCRTKTFPNVFYRAAEAGVIMKHHNQFVPLALMGSLSAAIMVVFALTVMH
jgi:hypothetical protein